VDHACNPSYQEAEIRKIEVQNQPRQIVCDTLSPKYKKLKTYHTHTKRAD
jgi:hypothetical protein